jgi:hypothetical protein
MFPNPVVTEKTTTVSATIRLMRLSFASALSSISIPPRSSHALRGWINEFGLGHQLAGVHDSQRIERLLDRPKRVDPARREARELGALELTDTVQRPPAAYSSRIQQVN